MQAVTIRMPLCLKELVPDIRCQPEGKEMAEVAILRQRVAEKTSVAVSPSGAQKY